MRSRTHRSSAGRGQGSVARSRSLTIAGLLAVAGALVLAVGAAGSTAGSARTITLNDSGQLHKLGSSHGFYLNETGRATGTINGTLSLRLHIVSTNRVTAEVNIYPSGSSMSGSASGSYHVNGSVASFSGSMSITHGTGSYAHAHGSGLSFSGTIQRKTDAVTVHVSGKLSV
jgi:hypothetical protein